VLAGLGGNRVARWHIFKPKIPIWVNFGGSYNGRCKAIWSILLPFGILYGYFGIFFPFWNVVPRKIWQSCGGNPRSFGFCLFSI
jgi:hypothetical protein